MKAAPCVAWLVAGSWENFLPNEQPAFDAFFPRKATKPTPRPPIDVFMLFLAPNRALSEAMPAAEPALSAYAQKSSSLAADTVSSNDGWLSWQQYGAASHVSNDQPKIWTSSSSTSSSSSSST